MIHILIFLAAFFFAAPGFGQIPPGFPYDAARHPNPIVTWVTSEDFKSSTYSEAQKVADIELFGLSQEEGRRESIEVAALANRTRKVRILGREIEVMFYPVVRQTFTLEGGGRLVLLSFKFPRHPVPRDVADSVFNESALTKPKDPREARFGTELSEMTDIRGEAALLFDGEEQRTLFWVEAGVAHTATTTGSTDDLVRIVEDLL